MRNTARAAIIAVIGGLLAAVVAACGSSSSGSSSATTANIPLKAGENPVGQTLYGKTKGGTLTVYSSEDFEHLDPGEAYFVLDYADRLRDAASAVHVSAELEHHAGAGSGDGDADDRQRRDHRRRQDRHGPHPAERASSRRRSTAR